jgi:hypothetical protein
MTAAVLGRVSARKKKAPMNEPQPAGSKPQLPSK